MRILFLTARFPYPLRRGDQLRAFQQLRLLSARHRLTLLCFHEGRVPAAARAAVSPLCERVVTIRLGPAAMALGLARGALSDLPFQALLYRQGRMGGILRDLLRDGAFDLVHAQLARMAHYLEGIAVPRFVDLVDALSLSMRRRSEQQGWPVRWLSGVEAQRLLRYERKLCETLEGAAVVSSVDRHAIGEFPRLGVVPNGVDLAELPFGRSGRDPRAIVFTGNLGYFANVNGALWFARRVLPLIRRAVPDAHLRLVGARPARALRRLARQDRAVTLLPDVDDVRPHVRAAAVAVAPLQAGAGQQFKVLEAMASGTPVVATGVAAAALGEEAQGCLLVAEDPEEFAEAVVTLLEDRERADRLTAEARRLVEARHTWERSTALLEEQHAAAVGRR